MTNAISQVMLSSSSTAAGSTGGKELATGVVAAGLLDIMGAVDETFSSSSIRSLSLSCDC
jgi:hypothetical protein